MADVVPFPFVVGSGRSGTTLLRAMLDSHPDLAIPPESHVIPALLAARSQYELPDGFASDRFATELLRSRWISRWGLSRDDVMGAVDGAGAHDLPSGLRAVYRCYAETRGKGRYGDKTPPYVLSLPLLAASFPEARFVHLVRDARDVALSLQGVEFGPDDLTEGVLWWRRSVERGRRAGERLGAARYREARYEDLVAAPEAVLRDLSTWLELPYDGAMLQYADRADEVVAGVGRPEQHQNLRRRPAPRRDWRAELQPRELALIEELAGPLLTALGYERVTKPTAGVRARAAAVRVLDEQRRARRVLRKRRKAG